MGRSTVVQGGSPVGGALRGVPQRTPAGEGAPHRGKREHPRDDPRA